MLRRKHKHSLLTVFLIFCLVFTYTAIAFSESETYGYLQLLSSEDGDVEAEVEDTEIEDSSQVEPSENDTYTPEGGLVDDNVDDNSEVTDEKVGDVYTGDVSQVAPTVSAVTAGKTCYTVLYKNHKLIINEPTSERAANTQANGGGILGEWDPLDSSNPYVFKHESEVPWNNLRYAITSVAFGSSVKNTTTTVKPTSMAFWFCNTPYLNVVNSTNLDTSEVTSMAYLFGWTFRQFETQPDNDGRGNVNWDLTSWNTSKVTDMSYIFHGVGYKTGSIAINMTGWDTSKVTSLTYAFARIGTYSCSNIQLTGIENWNTSSVTNMSYMFRYTGTPLKTFTVDLSKWNVSKVTNFSYMFDGLCWDSGNAVISLGDLSKWNPASATTMEGMFRDFARSSSAIKINFDFSNWNMGNTTNLSCMFQRAGQTGTSFSVNMANCITTKVTNMSYMFENAGFSAATFKVDLTGWNTSSVTNMNSVFKSAGFSAGKSNNKYNPSATGVTDTLAQEPWVLLGLENWNTENVTTMEAMFQYAGSYTRNFNLDLSNWNVSKVTNTIGLFNQTAQYSYTCTIGNLSKWNLNNVTNMASMLGSLGKYTDTAVDIGSISIPYKTNLSGFANGAQTLKGTVYILNEGKGSSQINENTFNGVATTKNSDGNYIGDVMIIPANDTLATWVKNNFIANFGMNGTTSQGNLHLPYLDVEVDNLYLNYAHTSNGDIVEGTLEGNVTIINNSDYCQVSADVTASSATTKNGWSIVPSSTNFALMAANTKQVALLAKTSSGTRDLLDNPLNVVLTERGIGNGNIFTYQLIGKVGMWKYSTGKEEFCEIPVTVNMVFGHSAESYYNS
jgi:surface protein